MAKKKHIVRYTTEELQAMQARGESKSDWARAAAMTQEEGMVVDWSTASVEMPQPKAVVSIRVDRNVLEFFRSQGAGYQTRMNAVLRSYVEHAARRERR